MLSMSWRRWPDILIDFGREIYIPWRIANGAVLYKDIAYFNGPFAPYLNAILFTVFGTSLMTLVIFNILLVTLLTYLIYRIFCMTTDRLTAVAAGVTFLVIFAFSQYGLIGNSFNYLCPYSYDITYGLILSFLALYIFSIYIEQKKLLQAGSIGILLGLVFLTKLEISVSISVAILCGMAILFFVKKFSVTEILKTLGTLFAAAFLPIMVFTVYISSEMPLTNVFSLFVTSYRALFNPALVSNLYYRFVMGTDTPIRNSIIMIRSAAYYFLILLISGLLAGLLKKIPAEWKRIRWAAAVLLAALFLTPFIIGRIEWLEVVRGLPIALVTLSAYFFLSVVQSHRNNDTQNATRLITLFTLALFSTMLLSKIVLNVHVYHYGFVLAMPATLLLVMIFVYEAPKLWGKVFGNISFMRGMALALILIAMTAHIAHTKKILDVRTYAVGSGQDRILAVKPEIAIQGAVINIALEKIREIIPQDSNFAVFPEGVMLNYLTRIRNPTPYIVFLPPELYIFGEGHMLEALNDNPPEYIILIDRKTSIYGYPIFGTDYGLQIFAWIKENYDKLLLIGNPPLEGKGFGVIIAKRKSSVSLKGAIR